MRSHAIANRAAIAASAGRSCTRSREERGSLVGTMVATVVVGVGSVSLNGVLGCGEYSGDGRYNTPVPRFKVTVEYAGTRFSGWQIQKNARTVQGEIDRAVRTVTRR